MTPRQPHDIPLEARIISATNLPETLGTLRGVLASQASILLLPADWQATQPDLPATMRAGQAITPGCLIACTSGSTGTPKGAVLGVEQLIASGDATTAHIQAHFGTGPGAWLLALPAHHIAGLQVMLRSLRAGFEPLAAEHLRTGAPFTAAGFAADTRRLRETYPEQALYTSLVPAQLERLAGSAEGIEALKDYSCVLVGGAAARGELVSTLREAGARIALTYGSSETAGGVVYDGHPLPGAHVSIAEPDAQGVGRVHISGPMVARGYRNVDSAEAFRFAGTGAPCAVDPTPGAATFITSDLGVMDPSGVLRILGRADGAINSGGYKVLPEDVERTIHAHVPHVLTVGVAGVDHPEFGQAAAALVEFSAGHGPAASESRTAPAAPIEITVPIREQLRGRVPAHLIPRRAWAVEHMPLLGPGKLDRRRIAEILRSLQEG